jgi:hypothetical protein
MTFRFPLALVAAAGVAVGFAAAPAAAQAGTTTAPEVSLGLVAVDPTVEVDPDGLVVGAGVTVDPLVTPPLDLGLTGDLDRDGFGAELQLPDMPAVDGVTLPPTTPVDELVDGVTGPVGGVVHRVGGALDGLGGTAPAPTTRAGAAGGGPAAVVAPGGEPAARPLVTDSVVAGRVDDTAPGLWSRIGHAAGRWAPWAALLAFALVAQAVARAALRDAQRDPRTCAA